MWNEHWSLKEGFTIGSGLVLTGLLLQFTIGPVIWAAFAWPANIITLGIFVLLCVCAFALRKKSAMIRFMMSYAAAVPALVFVVVITIIMGLTKQTESPVTGDPIGLSNCLSFWSFVLVYIWMTMIVGMVCIKQGIKISMKTMPSFLSHLGLFIVLTCGTLGTPDMQRLKMYCEEGKPEWRALDNRNKTIELPIAIQLDSFIIDEYPPKITLVENKTMRAVEINGKPLSVLIDDKFDGSEMGGYKVTVDEVINLAAPKMTADTTTYTYWPVKGATCAIHVKAEKISSSDKAEREGWISCGSYLIPSQMLTLDSVYSLGMAQREPQRYASKVQIFSEQGDHVETIVEVNKPYTLNGWNIYQYSYNEQMGKWSNYSVFELVSDPWLPVVYVGIGLIALGAMGMFLGIRRKEAEHVG